MTPTPKRLLFTFAGILGASVCSSQVVVQFVDNDLNTFANPAPQNWSITAGSGFLTAASDANFTSINGSYYIGSGPADTTFLLSGNGHSLTLEVTYLWKGVNIQANGTDVIRLGIDTGKTDPLPDYSGVLRANASGNRNHRVGNYDGTNLVASATSTNIINANVPVILETVFTRVDAATLTMATTLWNAAKTNASIPTMERTVTVAVGYFDNPLYAGLFINGDAARTTTTGWSSVVEVDNFTMTYAVPEPAAFAALCGLLALGGVIWHRRRRNR